MAGAQIFVSDTNINRLLLAKFVKQGDRLKMQYSTPLPQSHHHKIYGVLQNICYVGDRYDDEFCSRFGATRCYEPQVKPYPPEVIDHVYDGLQQLGKATLEALNEYNAIRAYGYSWNLLDTTFYQIAFFANPQGQFYNELEKAIDDMDDELPTEELVSKGMAFLNKLLATPKEKLAQYLYYIDKLVSNRRSASLQNIQEVLKAVYEEANAAMQAKDFERSAVRLLYILYETLFYNDIPDDIKSVIVSALEAANGQSVEQASNLLYDAIDRIMDDNLTATPAATQQSDNAATKDEPVTKAAVADLQKKLMENMAGSDIMELQQKMTEAMARGDMAEYMRLAGELQQKMMSKLFS